MGGQGGLAESAARHGMIRLSRALLLLALLLVRAAEALDPDRHITELPHRSWTVTSGAPSQIWALAQTTDGYIWAGSQHGLYRFDGVQFQRFDPDSGSRLPSESIWSLFATPDGKLWIGYTSGTVSVVDRHGPINYSAADGLPKGPVAGFALDRQGRIWAASSGGLACLENGRWRVVGEEAGFPGSSAHAVLVDHLGSLWVAGEHRIAVLAPHASKFELTDEPYDGQVGQLAESAEGTVWLAETSRAVRPLTRPGQPVTKGLNRDDCFRRFPDTWKTEPRCHRPDDLEVRVGSIAMLFDRDGGLWITTLGDGLRRAPRPSRMSKEPIEEFSTALEQFTRRDGLSADYVSAILEDREGNIWVSTRDGIDQFRDSVLAPVTLDPSATQFSIASADQGYVVVASPNGHWFRVHDAHSMAEGSDSTGWLYRDPFGSTWRSGGRGVCRIVGDHCVTSIGLPGESWLHSRLAVDGQHRLWAYVLGQGLFTFNPPHWTAFNDASRNLDPTTAHTDSSGRIWFGSLDGRLLSVTGDLVHVYSPEDGLSLGWIKTVVSAAAHVWAGGAHGLAVLRGAHFTAVLPYDAPAFGSISGIVEGEDGSVWLNESRGVLRVPATEVSELLRNSSHPIHYDVFDTHDGVPGSTEQMTGPAAIRGTDGRLWFTTSNGAAWVDPKHLHRNRLPPPVVIQSIVADDRTLPAAGKVQVPSRTANLQIAYAGLSFSVPERVQFRYRLKGFDDKWQNAGTRRTAYYTRLPPGSYDFQVIAANETGVWNRTGAQLPIRVIPAWYQTWWFYSLCAILFASALAALYRVRLAQVRAVLEARLSERERIANDLHDTLLQGMAGTILRFQAEIAGLSPQEPLRQRLELTLDRADNLLQEGRDRVQALRTHEAGGRDLVQALAVDGEQLAQLYSTSFQAHFRGDFRDLQPSAFDEMLLIAREALNNAFRHSGAKNIEAEAVYGDDALHVSIRDDGCGISASMMEAGGKTGHFGLRGMRERARRLGGQLEIRSKPEVGTEVELHIPAHVAYGSSASRPARPRSWLSVFRADRGR